MAEFSKLVITNKGRTLLAKMIAGSSNIEFTKISASSTTYTDTQLEGLTALANVEQTNLISKVTRTNDVTIKVETAFTNTELTAGYYMRVLGLYAIDPDDGEILYAVTKETSGNCYMPAYNGTTVSGAYIQLVTTVGNAQNVSLEVEQAVFATIGDIKRIEERLERINGDDRKVAGEGWIYQEDTRTGVFKSLNVKGKSELSRNIKEVNPGNPVEITGIGENRILVLTCSGKNLWNLKNQHFPATVNGVTVNYDRDEDVYILNGTITQSGFLFVPNYMNSLPCRVKKEEKYTLSAKVISGSSTADNDLAFVAEFYDDNDEKLVPRANLDCNIGGSQSESSVYKVVDENTQKNAKKIGFGIYLRNIGSTFTNYQLRVQFECGEKSKWERPDYQQAQIVLQKPLYSLPNGVCDSIEKRGESWGVVRRVGRGEFRETNRIARDARFDTEETFLFKIYFPMPNKLITRNDFNLYCNFFYVENIYAQSEKEGAYTTDGLWIRMKKSRLENTEENNLREWATTGEGSEGFVLYEIEEQFEEFDQGIQTILNNLRVKDGETNLILSELAPIYAEFYNHIKTTTEELEEKISSLEEDTHNYLPLEGGTLSGDLGMSKDGREQPVLSVLTSSANGNSVGLEAWQSLLLFAGESKSTVLQNLNPDSQESMFVFADNDINFYSNLQGNNWEVKKEFVMSRDGSFKASRIYENGKALSEIYTTKELFEEVKRLAQDAKAVAKEALKTVTEMTNVIKMLPSQSKSLTYTGSLQTPEWNNYNPSFLTMSGSTSGTNAGTYTATFTPKTGYKWEDGTTSAKNVTWSIGKAAGSLSISPTSLSFTAVGNKTIAVTRVGNGAITAVSSNTNVATVSVSGNTVTVSAKKGGTATITIKVAAGTNHNAPANRTCSVTANFPKIYGVSWDDTSTTRWTRTDDAAGFTDPVPYVAGATRYSSPFDNIQPWAGMVKSERAGGTMVAIPKFWYKLTQNGIGLKIQISNQAISGYSVSPAHMNRGDGRGERDVVYIGRYHCGGNPCKSVTGEIPKDHAGRSEAREIIHRLGANIWQTDFAMRFTLWLLYLVEFSDWNSQEKIGYGCGDNKGIGRMGYTDSMPYHTGTTQSSRTTYGLGTQYRNIEGLWDNLYDWCDGCYCDSKGLNIILNPNKFSDNANGVSIGAPVSGSAFSVKTEGGFPLFVPTTTDPTDSSAYLCDAWAIEADKPCIFVGGEYYNSLGFGLFYVGSKDTASSNRFISYRLQELP